MQPDPAFLLQKSGIRLPLIGFYDAPQISPFAPTVRPAPGSHRCVFSFFEDWCAGRTLHLAADQAGCGGAGHWLCGVAGRDRESFVAFLVGGEGLKATPAHMHAWLDHTPPYRSEHPHILIGPLRAEAWDFLKTITFLVTPDQLSLLMTGAQYHSLPGDPPPVIAPFGAGCMQLVVLLRDLDQPQAVIGATDIAMRRYLPPEILAFTLTRPLFERLCALDEQSFLCKPFWRALTKARS